MEWSKYLISLTVFSGGVLHSPFTNGVINFFVSVIISAIVLILIYKYQSWQQQQKLKDGQKM